MTTRLAVIGAGHLGRIHAKLLHAMSDVQVCGVVDVTPEARQIVAQTLGVPVFREFSEIEGRVDGVVVATPTVTHYDIARPYLSARIPVLLEKPLAPTVAEARLLTSLARERETIFQVGHVERFNGAFTACRDAIHVPRYIETRRTGPYSGRSIDIGVVLDLMIHDIDLILAMVPSKVTSVRAMTQVVYGGHEDLAHAEIEFANGALGHCIASRCHATPSRTMQVICDQQHWTVDFSAASVECVTTGSIPTPNASLVTDEQSSTVLRSKTPNASTTARHHYRVPVSTVNALQAEQREFIAAIRGEVLPTVDGAVATRAIEVATQILEDADHRQLSWEQASKDLGLWPTNIRPVRRAG